MNHWLWLGGFLCCLTTIASGEEYELHLDEVELIEQPGANIAPKETTVRQIEVLVKPNQPFRFKMQAGKETITFSGKLKPSEDKNSKEPFIIDVKYQYEFDSGVRVAIDKNRTKPLPDITSFNTTLGLKVNEPINAAEITTTRNEQPGKPVKVNLRYVLVLKKYNFITARQVTKKHKA
jgi:hypothetical protein